MSLNFIQRINLLVYAAAVAFFTFIKAPMVEVIRRKYDSKIMTVEHIGFHGINHTASGRTIQIDTVRLIAIIVGLTLIAAAIHFMFSGKIEAKKPRT